MATCDDRQLTEAQRVAGYQNQRTGVQQAVRPFTGRPTLDNLIDYINRELQPAVRRTRDAVNDVYLQVADNAPSGNPLAYYFSTETGAADPTVGRIRLDASPQNTATVVRISQTNARLVDVAPWLDVMAGSSTTPLGVVTLSDAINPGRSLRFDLNTMVDQGAYWELGVAIIESTHPDPFVEGEAVVLAFIPGVASTGTTVPPGALTPIGANTVLGNPTTSTAAPTEIAIAANSVLGRAGAAGTGNIEAITVPGTGVDTGESVFLQSSSLRNHVRWDNLTLAALPLMGDLKFVGNVSGVTARPAYIDLAQLGQDLFGIGFDSTTHNFKLSDIITDHFLANITGATTTPIPVPLSSVDSTSLVYDGTTHTFQRAALTGDVTSAQDNNTVTINADAVTDAKLRNSAALSVIGRAANSSGDPADISATAASGAVLRESGDTLGFGTIATAGLADDSVTNAKLAEMVANTVKANATSATANPTDVAIGTNTVLGRVAGDIVAAQLVNAQITDGTIANAKLANMADATVKGRALGAGTGSPQDLTGAQVGAIVRFAGFTGATITAGTYNDHAITDGVKVLDVDCSGGNVEFTGFALGTSNTGGFFTIAKFGADGQVILRHNNAGSAAANRVFTPNGVDYVLDSTLDTVFIVNYNGRWQVVDRIVATAGIGNDQVTDAKLRNSAALSVIGRSANSSGDPADISTTSGSNAVLRESGGTLGFGTIVPGAVGAVNVLNLGIIGTSINDQARSNDERVITADPSANISLTGVAAGRNGDVIVVRKINNSNLIDLPDESASSTAANRWVTSDGSTIRLQRADESALAVYENSRWNIVAPVAPFCNTAANVSGDMLVHDGLEWIIQSIDGDRGDVTVSSRGTVFTIDNDVVTDAKLRNSAALSVIGRSANSTGDPADIAAASDGDVLRRSGTTLGFGAIATAGIADNAVTDAKIRDSAACSVIGRSANSSGDPADISAGTNNHFLRRVSNVLGFGDPASTSIINNGGALERAALTGDVTASQNGNATTIANDAVTLAKMADLAQSRIIGRAEGAGTGDPTALTPTQVVAIIDGEDATWTGSHAFNGSTLTASTSSNITLTSGSTVTLAATTQVQITSPTRLASSVTFDSVGTTASTAANDLAINSVNVVRFTGGMDPLTGMVPVVDGQTVLLVNAHASTNMGVHIESASSAAANRFAGIGTSRVIRPGEMALAWYDGASDRWRLLCRDEVDL